jgi:hypothetical protein
MPANVERVQIAGRSHDTSVAVLQSLLTGTMKCRAKWAPVGRSLVAAYRSAAKDGACRDRGRSRSRRGVSLGLASATPRGCVLMGSGPSLNRIDIPSLATVDTLAFNRSYLAWAEWGFAPTHYCCFDMTFVEHHAAELASVIVEHPATGFHINARAFDCGVPSSANVTWVTVASSVTSPGTSTASVLDLGNVGASSLQVHADVGYQRVVLVGVDGAYHAGQTHFRPDYSQGLCGAATRG